MSKFQIKSIFEQIATEVFSMRNPNQAKQFIIEFINGKEINEQDKFIIINNVNKLNNISRIQSYICNSLLKYEGLSVNK